MNGDLHMIKKTLIATALLASSSAAMAEISANVTLASDYVFRGVSQTDNQMAIQGGFDWGHDSGFYVGTWASNVDSQFFGGAPTRRSSSTCTSAMPMSSATALATTSVTCVTSTRAAATLTPTSSTVYSATRVSAAR
jgi:hypothetical protein